MKIEKQLPITTALDPRASARTPLPEQPTATKPAREARPQTNRTPETLNHKESGFSLQLNQQLSSMQAADHYLGELSAQLSALKLHLSRQLSSATPAERDAIGRRLVKLNDLLKERSKLSGESLDATLKLRLNEPLRSRFSLQGLESIDAIQRAGQETLIATAGHAFAEPIAVVLEEGMNTEQILRRLNGSLGQAGIRAELDQDGALKFSAPEKDWAKMKDQLRIQGEGKLFPKGSFSKVSSHDDAFGEFPSDIKQGSQRELRQLLESVVTSLDRVNALRDQLSQRQADVREFLARQESLDETNWASTFAEAVFNLQARKPTQFAVISQTVIAQANLTRFAVVSLLS
jgi:hypothetical protein